MGSTRLHPADEGTMEIDRTFLDLGLWDTGYNRAMKELLID